MTVASFIAAQRTDHGVPHAKCCRWLGVKPSTFYKCQKRPPTATEQRRARLDAAVRESFEDSGGTPGTYGSPRVFEDLVADGWSVSVNTVAASMARQGLVGRTAKRKRRSLTRPDKAAEPIPDLVGRDYSTGPIDQRWCGDLTEIPTGEAKLYLAIVLDLGSRRLAGFAMSEHHDSAVAKAALCMAAAVRGGSLCERPTYPRLLSWFLLEGIDPVQHLKGFPMVAHLVKLIASETDRSSAQLRTQSLLVFAAGWFTTADFMATAAALGQAERVKGDETTSHADWMSASRLGSLIHATSGSFGGVGGWWRNRAGFAS